LPGFARDDAGVAAASLATVVPDSADRFPHTTWLLSEGAESTSNSNTTSYVEQQARMKVRVGLELLMDGWSPRCPWDGGRWPPHRVTPFV